MRRGLPLLLASALLAVAVWVQAVQLLVAACRGGVFSCAAIVRPSLASLGPVPVATVLLAGALVEVGTALVFLVRPEARLARAGAVVSALGAGFAVGVQPAALIPAQKVCAICALAVLAQVLLAGAFARAARRLDAPRRPILGAFLVAILGTSVLSTLQGVAQAREDARRRAALAAIESKDARLVLVEAQGCPYCEALELDVLATHLLPRLERTHLRRVAEADRPDRGARGVPVLVALSKDGAVVARHEGFSRDLTDYEEVLTAAERP